jgi:hypothetical protein
MGDLPLIDAAGLTRAQRDGHACVSCRKRWPRPTIPVGRTGTGAVLYRCPDCLITLAPADPGLVRILTTHSDCEYPS